MWESADQGPPLFALWCETLGLETVDVPYDVDFFSLGGTSYQAVEFIERAQRALRVDVDVRVVFLDGTFAAVLDSATAVAGAEPRP
jgi:hypothetical protein